jgi:hypothetical protein
VQGPDRVTWIINARAKPLGHIKPPLNLPQRQEAGVRRKLT